MAFPGVRSAVEAVAGGGRVEDLAYDREGTRLARARSASADMDYKISRAANEALQTDRDTITTDALSGLQSSYGENPNESQMATLAQIASDLLSGKKAVGVGQQNEARGYALDAIKSGNPEPDAQNALLAIAGDKLLTPSNVSVRDQAGADLDYTSAMTNAAVSRGNASDRSNSNENVPGTVLNEIFYDGSPDGNIAEYYSWQAQQAINNPKIQNNQGTLRTYLLERRKKQGLAIGDTSRIEFDPNIVSGADQLSPADQKELKAYLDAQRAQ